MGLSTTGTKVLADMEKEYGDSAKASSTYSKGIRRPRRKPRKTGAARLTYRSKV